MCILVHLEAYLLIEPFIYFLIQMSLLSKDAIAAVLQRLLIAVGARWQQSA